jgi:predicted dehydrogenase
MRTVLVGAGRWGTVLMRKLRHLDYLIGVAEVNPARREQLIDEVGDHVAVTDNWTNLADYADSVVVATPPEDHFSVAAEAINMGKHVFVEKPLATTRSEAINLNELARHAGVTLMVGHLVVYSPEIQKLKEIVQSGDLGEIKYIHTVRLNLGNIAKEGVISHLAPHDLAICNYLLESEPVEIMASGLTFYSRATEVAFLNVRYRNDVVCHIHLSWIDPRKRRAVTVVGGNKMAVCSSAPVQELLIFDKAVESPDLAIDNYGSFLMKYRHGDVLMPKLEAYEPLEAELKHFKDCIKRRWTPLTDGDDGIRVVSAMETAERALDEGGWHSVKKRIEVQYASG